jgi:putative tricarboxylic transport membrane protein
MARKGQALRALALCVYASVIGGAVSGLALIIIAPNLARFALKFGPWEYFALVIFTFSCISSLSKGSEIKAFLAACLGLFLSTVGTDPVDALIRFTFEIEDFEAGFSVLPALIGVFAIPQLLSEADNIGKKMDAIEVHFNLKEFMGTFKELLVNKINLIRSCLLGIVIGILPGVGPGLSNVVAYAQAKNASSNPERFGTGVAEAVIAPECANNASMGGALIPLLTLGIPGDASTLMMLGSFMLHGIQPGPLLFRTDGDLVYAIFISYFLAFGFLLVFYHIFIKYIAKVITVPQQIMIPVLLVLCTIGSFALNNRMYDVYCFLGFGLLGYVLKHLEFPVLPVILGLILGHMAETQLRLAISIGNGSYLPFFTRPISLILIVISIVSLVLPIYLRNKREKRQKKLSS